MFQPCISAFIFFFFFLPSGDDANAEASQKKISNNFGFIVYSTGRWCENGISDIMVESLVK